MSTVIFTSHVPFDQPALVGITQFFKKLQILGHTVVLISSIDELLTDPWRLRYFSIQSCHPSLEDSLINEFGNNFRKWELRVDGWGSKVFDSASGYEFVRGMLIYSDSLLKALKPDLLLAWNPYQPVFGILYDLAKTRGITCGCLEWGIIQRSLLIDSQGTLSSSFLNTVTAEFLQNSEECLKYKVVGLDYLSSLQDDQPGLLYAPTVTNDKAFEWYTSDSNSMRVLCLGTSEYQGGMYPIDHHDRMINMPLFPSGWDLANTLAQNSEWKVLYKAHPHASMSRPSHCDALNLQESKVSAVELIKASNVVVAWGTKLELEALALGKPVVLAGSGLLWSKGCTYELTNPVDLSAVVQEASLTGVQSSQLDCLALYLGWLITEELFFFGLNNFSSNQADEEKLALYVNRFIQRFSQALILGEETDKKCFFLTQIQQERAALRMSQLQAQEYRMQVQEYRNPLVYYQKKILKKLDKLMS